MGHFFGEREHDRKRERRVKSPFRLTRSLLPSFLCFFSLSSSVVLLCPPSCLVFHCPSFLCSLYPSFHPFFHQSIHSPFYSHCSPFLTLFLPSFLSSIHLTFFLSLHLSSSVVPCVLPSSLLFGLSPSFSACFSPSFHPSFLLSFLLISTCPALLRFFLPSSSLYFIHLYSLHPSIHPSIFSLIPLSLTFIPFCLPSLFCSAFLFLLHYPLLSCRPTFLLFFIPSFCPFMSSSSPSLVCPSCPFTF